MVVLTLLVLLTVAAFSMSKNSFKEIHTSGFMKQGAMAKNLADSGIHWSIYWIDATYSYDADASRLIDLKSWLAIENDRSGVLYGLDKLEYRPSRSSWVDPDLTLPETSTFNPNYDQGFTIALTRMGKLPVFDISQGAGAGAYTPSDGRGQPDHAPLLWAIRSEARVKPPSKVSIAFTHTKEAWVSTPVR